MGSRRYPGLVGLVLLAGCAGGGQPQAPAQADFATEAVDLAGGAGPPRGPDGACWQSDLRPAVIETVTEQVLVAPERRDAAGALVKPAVYASESHQRIVSDRGTIWFRVPCPAAVTPEFIASLQRALKARGLYLRPPTGVMDKPTREALRRYQRAHGLDSDQLSLAAARALGLIVTETGRRRGAGG